MAVASVNWMLLVCVIALVFSGSEGQRQGSRKIRQENRPQSVKDILNTTSCIQPPYRCPHPKMKFYLYTRTTQEKGELLNTLDDDSLTYSKFNPSHPTKVVVHGFGGGRNLSPSTDMRNAYFTKGNYNIIIVDYGSLVKEPCLSQIEWAPRFAGLCIAQLVNYLQQHPLKGIPAEQVHGIGYSVGAHILGLVANHVNNGKLGRITGLDPTILFYMGNNRSRDLDHTDAHFVDILHTGAGILGQWGPNGHADFYVNGGSSQPGCAHDTIFQTLSCDHTKVTPYFIESINSREGFWAGPCPSLFSYLIGWCEPKDTEYVLMGEHLSPKARGVFYVTTNAKPPYARGFPGKSRRLRSIEWAPRFAGLCIAQLVNYLQQHPLKGIPAEQVHGIGYSVGAHILGLVANHVNNGKLGRITGLDPTILFYMGNNRSRDLDHTDAHFVDILHTGAGILGQWGPNGHADFYVNGGSSQPGCAHDTIFQTLSCDHTKVTPYFIESINSREGFWAGPCPSLFSYLIGWCEPKDTEYVLMGEHLSPKARGVFYVTTNAKPPYARGFPGKSRRLRSVSPYTFTYR